MTFNVIFDNNKFQILGAIGGVLILCTLCLVCCCSILIFWKRNFLRQGYKQLKEDSIVWRQPEQLIAEDHHRRYNV